MAGFGTLSAARGCLEVGRLALASLETRSVVSDERRHVRPDSRPAGRGRVAAGGANSTPNVDSARIADIEIACKLGFLAGQRVVKDSALREDVRLRRIGGSGLQR